TEALDQLDLRRIVVDQGHRVTLGAQQAGDDLAEAAVAEDDDLAAFYGEVRGQGGGGGGAVGGGRGKKVGGQQQERRQRHRERHDDGEELLLRAIEQGRVAGELQQHEGELAGLAQQDRHQQPLGDLHAEERAEHVEHDDLDADDHGDKAQDLHRLG